MSSPPPIACDPDALDASARAAHAEVAQTLFAAVTGVDERPDGYALRLPPNPDLIQAAGAFVARERTCCPFLTFTLRVAANDGPVWLALTGREGVKAYLDDALLPRLDVDAA